MKKFLSLVKVNLIQAYRPKKNTTKKTMPVWVLYLIIAVAFLPILIMLFKGLLSVGKYVAESGNAEYAWQLTAFIITALQAVVMFFGFRSMIGTVYMSTDSDMLLVLPVRNTSVFLSKFAMVYLTEFVSSFGLCLFTLLPFGIGMRAGAGYYLTLLISTPLIPLLPLTLVSILSVPMTLLLNLFKNKGAIGTILYIILFVGIMGGYMYFITKISGGLSTDIGNGATDLIEAAIGGLASSAAFMYPNVWLARSMNAAGFGGWIGNFALFFLCAAALFALTILLSRKVFVSNMRKSQESAKSVRKTGKHYGGTKKVPALLAADFKNMLRESSLGFYCLVQIIMIPLIMVIFGLSIKSATGSSELPAQAKTIMNSLSTVILYFMGLMTCVSASCAVSRERGNFYLMKTIPVRPSQFVSAKLLLSTIFNELTFLIAIVILALFIKPGFFNALSDFVTVSAAAVGVSSLQILLDLRNPRLNWTHVQQGLKNNPASLWGMLIGFGVGLLLGGMTIAFAFVQAGVLGKIIPLLIGVAAGIAGVLILFNNADKYFYAVE